MSVKKGEKIIAQEILDYLAVKAVDQFDKVTQQSFLEDETASTRYFWMRNDPDLFTYSAYGSGVTYDEGDRINSGGVAWKSLVDTNIGNTPVEGADWTRLWPLDSQTGKWTNAQFDGEGDGLDSSYYHLWKITWPGGIETATLVSEANKFTHAKLSLVPGYYKYTIRARSAIWKTSNTSISLRRADSSILKDADIRVMSNDWTELIDPYLTPVTVALAKGGRLSTENFLGGDYGA